MNNVTAFLSLYAVIVAATYVTSAVPTGNEDCQVRQMMKNLTDLRLLIEKTNVS